MTEGITCYERDETLCEDQMCLRTGCRLRNERLSPSYPGSAELLALAVDYETGLQRMVASGYEEFSPDVKRNHQMVIDALRFRARAVAQGWRDIETAPKDGNTVVVWDNPVMGEAYYDIGEKSWWWANTGPGDYTARAIYPTLWHPMPDKPTSPVPSTLRQCPICARRVASPCETLAIATSCPLSSTTRGTAT